MNKAIEQEQQIVDLVSSIIKSDYLNGASLSLQQNKGDKDSITITVNNNPWRNGVINGDMLFGRIKTGGKVQYIQVKSKYSDLFSEMGLSYTSNKSESDEGMIRIGLSEFCSLLAEPTELFVQTANLMFTDNISFAKFGCCSKYSECKKEGKCLHTDQLYATACQWQKHLKGNEQFE